MTFRNVHGAYQSSRICARERKVNRCPHANASRVKTYNFLQNGRPMLLKFTIWVFVRAAGKYIWLGHFRLWMDFFLFVWNLNFHLQLYFYLGVQWIFHLFLFLFVCFICFHLTFLSIHRYLLNQIDQSIFCFILFKNFKI